MYETVNLGMQDNPQNINLGKGCYEQERSEFIKLFKEFKYVFSWTYDDLKNFDPNIIKHVIPNVKNKIHVDLMPAKNLIVAYYTKALHNNIAIWVKRSKKNTLLESFEEVVLIEKDILRLKDSLNSEVETTSSSKKKIEILTRPPQTKNQQETLDLESLQKSF
jgi:hypothetical protein